MIYFAFILIFSTVALCAYSVIPMLYDKGISFGRRREQQLTHKMDKVLPRSDARKMARLFIFAPFIGSVALYLLFPQEFKVFGVIAGFILGLVFPGVYTQQQARQRQNKFSDQLIDALMIMSSSFRGGLSLIQAMEAVVEEMPDPINYEFGTVLGENKMGVSLDDAMSHLYNRMPSPALQQMITAILLARETGGNLPAIFSRIVTTIRERKKIQQNLDTLTLQGKLQGAVMSLLPFAFASIVQGSNPHFFDTMFYSDTGRSLLMLCFVLWVVGAFFILKISTFKDF